ncbi:MAG: hypothetical protein D3904_17045 [Candidatus Electrothrix sp. EH2]|nr:hypothetical protein [Candidatus Electrothrix sp. EH2]
MIPRATVDSFIAGTVPDSMLRMIDIRGRCQVEWAWLVTGIWVEELIEGMIVGTGGTGELKHLDITVFCMGDSDLRVDCWSN